MQDAFAYIDKEHQNGNRNIKLDDVFDAVNASQAELLVKKLAKEYSIIFITEDLAQEINNVLMKYKTKAFPAIIPIPSSKGSTGYREKGVKADVEKAIGTDILFSNKDD